MSGTEKQRMTPELREEATRRVLAGEKAAALAREYGCTRAYISLLKAQAIDPERFLRKSESKLSLKLTREERQRLKELFETSTPEDNELIPARETWNLDHGFQLARKLFDKKPSVRAMKELMGPLLERRADDGDPMPKPPKPPHVNQLDPELAQDPDFVAYYLSPICQKIRWREYELALADWHKRNEARQRNQPEPEPDDMMNPSWTPMPQVGKRIGKHARSKGSPFTKPKRRKGKRR